MPDKTILILGGTRDALDLATVLSGEKKYRIITSLAGRTKSPRKPDGELRVGGFGGVKPLADYLVHEGIDFLVDATHPFAAAMSRNAAEAAAIASVPRILLQRPPWSPKAGDQWESFADLPSAARGLKPGARCFLTIGHQELGQFSVREDIWFLVRMIDAPQSEVPLAQYQVVTGLPSGDADEEKALMQAHQIDTLVTKNSGGLLAASKLEAARNLSIRVMMIERPQLPVGHIVETVKAVRDWIFLA